MDNINEVGVGGVSLLSPSIRRRKAGQVSRVGPQWEIDKIPETTGSASLSTLGGLYGLSRSTMTTSGRGCLGPGEGSICQGQRWGSR